MAALREKQKDRSLDINQYIKKKWKNRHSDHHYRCRGALQYGGYWTPDGVPSKVRRSSKNKEIRNHYKKLIKDELKRQYYEENYSSADNTQGYESDPRDYITTSTKDLDIVIAPKYKRKRVRMRKKNKKKSSTYNFESYWKEMKAHNIELIKRQKDMASRPVDERKALNFIILFVPDHIAIDRKYLQTHCIAMDEILWIEPLKIRSHAHSYRLHCLNMVLAHNKNHKKWKNYKLDKMNISFFTYLYESSWSNADWLAAIKRYKLENLSEQQMKIKFIRRHVHNKKGFEYVQVDHESKTNEKKTRTMNIRINIKLDKVPDIEPFDYKQNVQINEDLAFEQQAFTLKNFSLRECTLDLYENQEENGKRIHLKPQDGKAIFIPMHVAKNEAVNRAIAEKLKFKHKMCKIQRFASKIIGKLLVLEDNEQEKRRERLWRNKYRYLKYAKESKFHFGKIVEKWHYDECHYPNCNLLPLTCDLNRVLAEFMPYYDVLKDILIPFIGYSIVYYVVMEAKNVNYIEWNDGLMMNEDGCMVGFFKTFKGFAALSCPPKYAYNDGIKHEIKIIDDDVDSSESSSSVPAPINLFGDDFWTESD